MKLNSNINRKCKMIKLVLTDVDGVLTDGGRYFGYKGEVMKKFQTRDGMGVNILLRNGIKTAIISKERSQIVKRWAKSMNISKLYLGIKRKEDRLFEICNDFGIKKYEIAYIGDDVNDVGLMKKVGFSATPNDGVKQAKQIADYICNVNGGECAFREISDLILSIKFLNKIKWY